ncbi:uncharacterized protein PAC_14421 [Phialocephala subalpina]|uniref:Rhodopsin domain-containing protein n=1 Tax=Phialocephala subalpina TaxID=576137 RepID=A0A1L7XHK2_9HELO|nr:uncharacterized protein PAC_14421 [Phialocephala subalpina]
MATGLAPGSGLPDMNKGPQILGAVATTTILALTVVAMRLYVRIWMLRSASFDDYFIIAGMACSLISFGINIPDVIYGAGRHVAYISPPSKIPTGLKLNFVTQSILLSGVTFVKVSIGFFLLRIAPNNCNYYILRYHAIRTVQAIGSSMGFQPPSDSKLLGPIGIAEDELCQLLTQPRHGSWFCAGSMANIVEYTTRKAYQDGSLGCSEPSACIAGIIKITILPSYGRSGDFLYDSADLTIWTTTELNVGILAGSIPCLKPLYRILLEKSGCVPKEGPTDTLRFSYVMQSSDVRSNHVYGNDSQIEGRERSEYADVRKTELMKPTRVYVNDVSKESLLWVHGPGIVKATQIEVHSVEEGNSAVANEICEHIERNTGLIL